MALSEEKARAYTRRLLQSRTRLLCKHTFYGLLLMHMRYGIDEGCETAYTDGDRIAFSPTFMDRLKDRELDFVMMHEILHVVLQHCMRGTDRDPTVFNIACDIVVNSTILESNGMDPLSITISSYGESMHLTPYGREGYLYTAEEVYEMLFSRIQKLKKAIGNADGPAGSEDSSESASSGSGNSQKSGSKSGNAKRGKAGSGKSAESRKIDEGWDDHSRWKEDEDGSAADEWLKRVVDAATVVSITDPSNTRGSIPLAAERLLQELRKPQTDWRTLLNEFVQEEIVDYGFAPPDRRYSESPFFLPAFSEPEDIVENILFMIDTSASMSDKQIAAAYSEICGAIEQFHGRLQGYLGFFDAAAYEALPFEKVEDVLKIRPRGGGGTDFYTIFRYVKEKMEEKLPASIIVLTDGYAPFPPESNALGIPVLWLINNTEVTPPWGTVARITL